MALEALSREIAARYSGVGRPSIPAEKLLQAMLLQAYYSLRVERPHMGRPEFDLLFRWFVGIGVDDPMLDHSTVLKNHDRPLDGEITAKILTATFFQSHVK